MIKMENKKIAFFGTPEFSTYVLRELISAGMTPVVVVTTPDKPAGRGLEVTASPVKRFSFESALPVLQPEVLDDTFVRKLKDLEIDLIVVAAYGKILPASVLSIGTAAPLNVHPSLLPMYRGTSPVESQILAEEKHIGVSVIQMDEKMDHGPIVVNESIEVPKDITRDRLNKMLWTEGGKLLARIIPDWFAGTISAVPQDHSKATFTKKMTKENGLVTLSEDPTILNRKFRAYSPWPGLFFITRKDGKELRVKIKNAHLENGAFVLDTVIPENGKPMSREVFERWIQSK